jgi:hypothetical protein
LEPKEISHIDSLDPIPMRESRYAAIRADFQGKLPMMTRTAMRRLPAR